MIIKDIVSDVVNQIAESRNWQGIVMHHSATVDGHTFNSADIRYYHMSWKFNGDIISPEKADMFIKEGIKGVIEPYVDIGYNWCIEEVDGSVRIIPGRKLTIPGAHAIEFNLTHIGICVVGNFDLAPPSEEKWQTSLKLVRFLVGEFPITRLDVLGHRETYPLRGVPVQKSCPGTYFDMEKFRKEI